MSKFCLNPACNNPHNPEQNELCPGCSANLAESIQTYQFDYYRVTKLLGEGGFGRTYLAEYSRRYNQQQNSVAESNMELESSSDVWEGKWGMWDVTLVELFSRAANCNL